MKKFSLTLLAASLLTLSSAASATQIMGTIIFGGDLTFDFNSNSVDILGNDALVTASPTGSFSSISTGATATYNDFTYAPFSVVSPLWTIGGFSFTLNQIVSIDEYTSSQGHQFLTLAGNGTFTGNGYDATNGAWTFSADGVPGAAPGTGTFAFSSVNVPEPAVALLLGAGLIGFAASRKLRKTA